MTCHGSFKFSINPLNPELNPICCLLALLGANHFLHVSRIKVKSLTLRLLMSYIYDISTLRVKALTAVGSNYCPVLHDCVSSVLTNPLPGIQAHFSALSQPLYPECLQSGEKKTIIFTLRMCFGWKQNTEESLDTSRMRSSGLCK